HDRNKYAEMWLGQYYFLRRDYDETYYWYRKSARQGDSYAYLGLFDLYSHGQGVTQNMGKAEQWLKRGMLASEHSTG
ncbi:sel1 repeat family protein, partial [Acidithiobacillus ferrooxidans]|nr:sel1 repeat family protein [Acidithiobacillus ferrooxidans]